MTERASLPDAPTTAGPARRRRFRRLVGSTLVAALAVTGATACQSDVRLPGIELLSKTIAGANPFTKSVSVLNDANPGELTNNVPTAPDQGALAVNGTDPGLYAVAAQPVCDTASLGNQLAKRPDAGTAWAGVFGLRAGDIPWYLNTLNPVLLTSDTWVTNHSFLDGAAQPYQSVLQAGSPVYVDGYGVPRIACASGNPLAPPAAAPLNGYQVNGDPWPNQNVRQIHRVAYYNTHVADNRVVNRRSPRYVENPDRLHVQNVDDRHWRRGPGHAPRPGYGPGPDAFVGAAVVAIIVGNTLARLGPPPRGYSRPRPERICAPFRSDDRRFAERNGTRRGSHEANDRVRGQARQVKAPVFHRPDRKVADNGNIVPKRPDEPAEQRRERSGDRDERKPVDRDERRRDGESKRDGEERGGDPKREANEDRPSQPKRDADEKRDDDPKREANEDRRPNREGEREGKRDAEDRQDKKPDEQNKQEQDKKPEERKPAERKPEERKPQEQRTPPAPASTDPKPEPKPATPAPKPEPKPAAPAPKPEPKPAPAPKPEPKPAPAPKPEPKPAPAPAPKPEPKPAPAPEPKPEPKQAPAPAPEPAPKPAPEPEPAPQQEESEES